jgi:hypothetical protein
MMQIRVIAVERETYEFRGDLPESPKMPVWQEPLPAPAGVLFLETARPSFVFCFPLINKPFFFLFCFLLASQKIILKIKKC